MKNMVIIFLLIISLPSFSQNRINEYNQVGWYAIYVTPKISEKVSGYFELQARRVDFIKDWQQWFPRVGVSYKINDNVTALIGYAWILTYPYGETNLSAIAKNFPEHRMYEQLTVTSPIGKLNLTHRLRIEQRWLGRFNSINSEKVDTWAYVNRVRYMPRLDIPVSKDKKFYLAAYDEILIGFGKNVGENIFDQNRIALLAGYRFSPLVRLEGGYINQTLQLGREIDNKNVFQHNNGIVINAYFNIN